MTKNNDFNSDLFIITGDYFPRLELPVFENTSPSFDDLLTFELKDFIS